jgi:quercetin dioxygenase-like cupin family protein
MRTTVISHAAFGCATALLASSVTYLALAGWPPTTTFGGWPESMSLLQAHAQGQPAASIGVRQTELFKTTMDDVLGRVVTIRRTERDPGNGSGPHRHPGSHTFGYVLEGTYEVKVDDGPLQKLGPGETFYEPPGALHAVSRNGSSTQAVKYLVIQISDPTKPQTVPE